MARVARTSPRWTHRVILYRYPGGRVFASVWSRDAKGIEDLRLDLAVLATLDGFGAGLYVAEAEGEPFVRREPTTKGAA